MIVKGDKEMRFKLYSIEGWPNDEEKKLEELGFRFTQPDYGSGGWECENNSSGDLEIEINSLEELINFVKKKVWECGVQ